MKICPKCKKEQEEDQFPTKSDGKPRIMCASCLGKRREVVRRSKIIHREKYRVKRKLYDSRRLDQLRETAKRYRHNHPEKFRDARWRKQGIQCTWSLYNQLLEKQKFRCAICGLPQEQFSRALAVDHDHTSGKVRGLLCRRCNRDLGVVESLGKKGLLSGMLQYLEKGLK